MLEKIKKNSEEVLEILHVAGGEKKEKKAGLEIEGKNEKKIN